MTSPDIRAGVALLIAALSADGRGGKNLLRPVYTWSQYDRVLAKQGQEVADAQQKAALIEARNLSMHPLNALGAQIRRL